MIVIPNAHELKRSQVELLINGGTRIAVMVGIGTIMFVIAEIVQEDRRL